MEIYQMQKPRIKIISLACNESYFIPQWVYHHFYFGVNAIEIIVNRTVDNTVNMIMELSKIYTNLSYSFYDWLDIQTYNNPPFSLQESAYLAAYYNLTNDFEYVFFIDMDEFYMPQNCRDTLQQCIIDYNYPDVLSLDMLHVGGSGGTHYPFPFMSQRKFYFRTDHAVKSLVKCGLKPYRINAHLPLFKSETRIIDADGCDINPIVSSPNFVIHHTNNFPKKYFILHDYCRTPIFYLARIARGNVVSKKGTISQTMRVNRKAFWVNKYEQEQREFSSRLPVTYYYGFYNLFNNSNLIELVHQALISQYYLALESIRNLLHLSNVPWIKNFIDNFGLLEAWHHKILNILISFDSSLNNLHDIDPKAISNNSIDCETNSEYLLKLIKLYPFARTVNDEPLFVKQLLLNLLENNCFEEAHKLINRKDLIANTIFGTDWSIVAFGSSYERVHDIKKALKYYKKLYYCGYISILRKIQSLELRAKNL